MNFLKKTNRAGDKIFFYYDLGRGKGQRPSTGIFIFKKPKSPIEKNHNKEALLLLELRKSQLILEHQSCGSGYIPSHKFKRNFFDYYEEYTKENKRYGNRHLENSLMHFRLFWKKDFIAPIDITENVCIRFRQYLLDRFSGDTPANYYARFKRVLRAAAKDGYFRISPADDVKAKSNASVNIKENLEAHEYIQLLKTPCLNSEVQEGFILSCYTGLRFVDVNAMEWSNINGEILTTKIIQRKTGRPLAITLHPIARAILERRRNRLAENHSGKVFHLPTHDGCNKILRTWVKRAGIQKHITWHCARLSFSILLQDENVNSATVALLLGHTSTKFVESTYKRHRVKDYSELISKLPTPESASNLLNL